MYIKYNLKPDIINTNSQFDIRPMIKSRAVSTNVTQGSLTDKFKYAINVYCAANIEKWLLADCDHIELRLSQFSADELKEKSKKTIQEKIDELLTAGGINSETAEIASEINEDSIALSLKADGGGQFRAEILKESIKLVQRLKFENNLKLFSDTTFLTNFKLNSSNILNLEKGQKFTTFPNLARSNKNVFRTGKDLKLQKTFVKKHNYLLSQGIDPMFLFQNSFKKTSYYQNVGGNRTSQPLKLPGYDKYLKDIFEDIENKIEKISGQLDNKKRKVVKKLIIQKLVSTILITSDKLEKYGDDPHLLYIAKSKEGVNMQISSFPINIPDLIAYDGTLEYDINASRNKHSKVSKVVISNRDKEKNCNVDLYAKKINPLDAINSKFELIGDDVIIDPKSQVSFYDGDQAFTDSCEKLGSTKNIVYRSTLNFRNQAYDNAKTTFTKGLNNITDPSFASCTLVAVSEQNFIKIYATNLSDNINSIRLTKKRLKGYSLTGGNAFNQKSELITKKDGTKIEDYTERASTAFDDEGYFFDDYDVFDGKVYKYELEAILKSGENVKVKSNFCCEVYDKPQKTIKIDNIQVSKTVSKSDGGDVADPLEEKDNIVVNFNIKRRAPEIETIISQIFGKKSVDFFSEEIKSLKSIEAFIYSIKIESINLSNGERRNLPSLVIEPGSGQKLNTSLSFTDEVNKGHRYIYKITPRYKSTDSLIQDSTKIASNLADIAEGVDLINYAKLGNSVTREKLERKIITSIREKFSTNNALRKGIVLSDDQIVARQNADLFFDASSGDHAYFKVEPSLEFSPAESLQLSFISSQIIGKGFDNQNQIDQNNQKISKKISENYVSLFFRANDADYHIDYYAVFIKEGNSVYLDGAIHSRDRFEAGRGNNYRYLVTHYGALGQVDYFIVPVTKGGIIFNPQLIHRKIYRWK